MEVRSAASSAGSAKEALDEVLARFEGLRPDLAVLFATHHHGPDFEPLVLELERRLKPAHLLGCAAESVIGPDVEIEERPGLTLWAAALPGAAIHPFRMEQEAVEAAGTDAEWRALAGVDPEKRPSFLLLADPFSIDVERVLSGLDAAYPGAVTAGGMASGAREPGGNRLFLGGRILDDGLVGVALTGGVALQPIVSQGCRPVGKAFVVTKARENLILELGGRPAMAVLKETIEGLPERDQGLLRNGIHLGRVVDERLQHFGVGDFLIRSVIGVSPDHGIAVNDLIRPGRTVQFHVRDAKSASAELDHLLSEKAAGKEGSPAGALMFSCNGRGSRMFGTPNHDVAALNRAAPGCPVAGFFAAGEIGPVGGRPFIHGFTSSMVLLRARS